MSSSRIPAADAIDRVEAALEGKVTDAHLNHDQVDVTCSAEHLVEVMKILRDAEGLRCRFFTFLSGVDRSAAGGEEDNDGVEDGDGRKELEVLIHVYSPENVFHVNVHVPVAFERPECPSITEVYSGAQWHERETWEMFGIDFPGHPRLTNLYLPEDFEGHPLLKSFKLPSRSVKEWPGAKDPEEAAAGGR